MDTRRRLTEFFTPETGAKAGFVSARYTGGGLVPAEEGSLFPNSADPVVTGLSYDSRKVKPGNLFFALRGIHADGHRFIADAIDWGAVVVVHEGELPSYRDWVIYIRVRDSRFAMSAAAAAFYGFPSRRLAVIGVTGTEGKSTTVYLIYQLLKLLGRKAGFISTVQQGDGLRELWNPEHQTTPEAPRVQELLAEMLQNGAAFAVVEASSHGLSKRTNRLGDVIFDVGVMTNVTHEHLEFHGAWEQYRSDKAELFRSLDSPPPMHIKLAAKIKGRENIPPEKISIPSFGVVNADDPSASFFAGATKHKTYTYSSRGGEADLSIRLIESSGEGNWYEVLEAAAGESLIIRDRLPGAFNAGNVLAALLTVSRLFSMPLKDLVLLVPLLKALRGRMTAIKKGQDFEVLVDYAHTPSSFMAILPPLRERIGRGRIICLFGSPGERDTKKRSEQGRIAGEYCDIIILSDEDPRGEDSMAILEEIASGMTGDSAKKRGETLFLIPDRPQGIRRAFSLAKKGDLVLLLGKGHENSIIYGDHTMPYDEIGEAEKALEEAGEGGRT
jgi:UDP-N-acetylmuramoyl-L-alanyl-D-glutamate--2,6-diaminopimelate ligase